MDVTEISEDRYKVLIEKETGSMLENLPQTWYWLKESTNGKWKNVLAYTSFIDLVKNQKFIEAIQRTQEEITLSNNMTFDEGKLVADSVKSINKTEKKELADIVA